MKKVDIPQVLISTAAIFGLGLLWYDFNMKIFLTVRDLMKAIDYLTFRRNYDTCIMSSTLLKLKKVDIPQLISTAAIFGLGTVMVRL